MDTQSLGRLFGTNGIRGVVNQDMNIELACSVGKSIGTYLGNRGEVLIGTDSRTSNEMLKAAVASGLMASGCDAADLGIVPTPAAQYAVRTFKASLGVVITASHNPPHFNGIKCIDSDGTELDREKEEEIERIYFTKGARMVTWDKVGRTRTENRANRTYADAVYAQVDVETIRRAKLKVVMDCSNGAGGLVSPHVFERLGCKVVTLNAQPQGTFPGHESEPIPENVQDLMRLTKATEADFGFVHDGDADRIIFADEKGAYLFGDKTLGLVAKHIVIRNKGGLVVTPISTSSLVEEVVVASGGRIEYTRVGAPIVARRMIETGAIFGGEENGGLIFPRHQYCRDGLMTAAYVAQIVSEHGRLSELVDKLPKYFMYKTKVTCPDSIKDSVLSHLAERMKDGRIETLDGLKVHYDKGWVLVRPSGTEPIYRVYAESKREETSKRIAEECKKKLEDVIKGVTGRSLRS